MWGTGISSCLKDKWKGFELETTQEGLGKLDGFVSEREALSAML